MPKIFKYQKFETEGPNGSVIHFLNDEENPAAILGEIDGWFYVSVPDETALPEQDAAINWQPVEPSFEFMEILKRTRPIELQKDNLRKLIEAEVGDLHDLVADSMRLNEFALALCLRVSHEVLTGTPMSEGHRSAYTDRVESALEAIDNGSVLLRGSIEEPTEMMQRLMMRHTRINELVRDYYKPAVSGLLP